MSAPPFMQMYWSDYFGDTRHLSCEQHGAYLQLIGSMWLAGGSLPNDPRKLAKVTGCSASRWAKIADDVLAFFIIDGDRITHNRISRELEKANEKSIKRAEAGSLGGKSKSLKNNDTGKANATDLPKHLPEPEPELEGTSPSNRVIAPVPTSTVIADGFAVWWLEYPNKVGKAAAQKAYAVACRKIGGPDPPATLLAGLRRAKSSDQWLRGFIPHPTTWLNQGRWEDEPSNAPQIDARLSHDAPRFDTRHTARQENHARAFAGFEAAARGRSERG